MIYRKKYIDEIRGFYDSDLIKIKRFLNRWNRLVYSNYFRINTIKDPKRYSR